VSRFRAKPLRPFLPDITKPRCGESYGKLQALSTEGRPPYHNDPSGPICFSTVRHFLKIAGIDQRYWDDHWPVPTCAVL